MWRGSRGPLHPAAGSAPWASKGEQDPLDAQGLQRAEPKPFLLRQEKPKAPFSSLLLLLMAAASWLPRPREAVPEDQRRSGPEHPRGAGSPGARCPGSAQALSELGKTQALAPSSDAGCVLSVEGLPRQAPNQPAPQNASRAGLGAGVLGAVRGIPAPKKE